MVGCQTYNQMVMGLIPSRDTIKCSPSWYLTNTKLNSAFHPPGVGKLSTGLSGWG